MRKLACICGAFLASSMAIAETKPAKLIVHEWGTFTNFAGSDGAYLDYRPSIGSDLPGFVFDRDKQNVLQRTINIASFTKVSLYSRSRMETPVTYFYTDEPMALKVRVDFPQGLLTEFYPPVLAMGPKTESKAKDAKPAIGKGFLDWGQITVFPPSQLEVSRRRIPPVQPGDPYAAARETDSDIVWATNVTGNYMEKFLFYRGVGNFDLPVKMQSAGKDHFQITNNGRDAIHAAFLVQVNDGKVRFTHVGRVEKASAAILSPEIRTFDDLSKAMAADLIAEGLYEKEAVAMVNTWKSSWFGEEGTRLLYLLPQSFTDKELPLSITPKPNESLRVMVGRLETLTPEMEDRITQLLGQLGAADCGAREEAMRQLRLMGRFAEPALQRVKSEMNDSQARVRAESVLAGMRGEN